MRRYGRCIITVRKMCSLPRWPSRWLFGCWQVWQTNCAYSHVVSIETMLLGVTMSPSHSHVHTAFINRAVVNRWPHVFTIYQIRDLKCSQPKFDIFQPLTHNEITSGTLHGDTHSSLPCSFSTQLWKGAVVSKRGKQEECEALLTSVP